MPQYRLLLVAAALLIAGPFAYAAAPVNHDWSHQAQAACERDGADVDGEPHAGNPSDGSGLQRFQVFRGCTHNESFRRFTMQCGEIQNGVDNGGWSSCTGTSNYPIGYSKPAFHSYTTLIECNDAWNDTIVPDGEGGFTCGPNPCDGGMFGVDGEPSQDTKDSINTHGYVCTPEEFGNCKAYYVGQAEDGTHLFQEDLEGAMCGPGDDDVDRPWDSEDNEGGPDPDGPNDPNDPDPPANSPCGSANPYDLFCFDDPEDRCPNGICDEGCGTFNGYFICQNPDNPNVECFNVLDCEPTKGDGDATGDGEVNIDLRPTNKLLQEIRNKLDDGTEPAELDENALGAKFDEWAENNPESEEKFLSDMNVFGIGIESGIFADLLDDATDITGQGAWGAAGGSCPSLEISLPYGATALEDTSIAVDAIRVVFNFIVWTLVAAYSWFIFTHRVFQK